VHHARLEVHSRLPPELGDHPVALPGATIRPSVGERVVHVCHGDDARRKRNRVAHQSVRVSPAVPPFVVTACDRLGHPDVPRRAVGQHVGSDQRVLHADVREQATPANFADFTIEENNYLRTVGALQDILDQQESVLAPETVAQLRASLRTIDEAILEARNALARDPANKVLIEMLSANYRQKVDLLRRTTEMTRGS